MNRIQENFADNDGVSIQYIVINPSAEMTPLIFIPGAITGADSILEGIRDYVNFYCIIISIRGRGKSDKPKLDYTIDSQVSAQVTIENCGHEIFYEKPAEALKIIEDFMN